MPISNQVRLQKPDTWAAFGHSYIEANTGTRSQAGRSDAAFRNALDIEFNNWKNCAVTGSMLMKEGVAQGGYARMFQLVNKVAFGAPYVSMDGGALLCWGINDLGKGGPGADYLSAFKDALRAVISRWRAGSLREDSNVAGLSFGAGFVAGLNTNEWSSGSTIRTATTTTNATFTITVPTDYTGTPIAICYNGIVNGGTVTYSGTAGVTGTFSTSNVIPAAQISHCPRIHRIKTLTAANAGQTIIGTVTALAAGGSVDFDCWWIEAENPAPVIVCDIPRLLAQGYSSFPAISANSEAVNDGHVNTWNAGIQDVINEFDGMVQRVYMDAALDKDNSMLWVSDGVHPTEKGAGAFGDAMEDAVRRLVPVSTTTTNPPKGVTSYLNPPNFREGSLVRHHFAGSNRWYAPDYRAYGANITAVAGNMYAIPLQFTIPNAKINMLGIEAMNAVAGTAIRWGLYDDPWRDGYPFSLMQELTATAALTVPTATGVVTSPAPAAAGSINRPIDPGIIWLVMKFTTVGAAHTFRSIAGPNLIMPNVAANGAGGSSPMAWFHTGQGTGVLPGRFPLGGNYVDPAPLVSFRLA